MKFFSRFFKSRKEVAQSSTREPEVQLVPLRFHLISIAITSAIIFKLVSVIIILPEPLENRFLIQSITPKDLAALSNMPVTIKTGLLIEGFREFDILNNRFVCEGVLWFEFNPLMISLETVSNFSFKNAEIKHLSAPKMSNVGQNLVMVQYDIVLSFNTELNYRFFPMDDHLISLVMVNNATSFSEAIFETDKQLFVWKMKTESLGWRQFYRDVQAGYVAYDLNSANKEMEINHPAVQFTTYFARAGIRYSLIILLPMLVFIIVMLTTFSYDPNKYFSSIMVANGASLSGLIAYRFVIENMSPKVGYFMLSDMLFFIFLFIAACIFLISIFSIHLSYWAKVFLMLLVHIFLIFAFSVLTWYVLKYSFFSADIV